MSVRWMTEVWTRAPFEGSTLLILLALADSANDDGVCWPAVDSIAAKARLQRRQTLRILAELEVSGWLRREQREGRSTIYRVQIGGGVAGDTGVVQDTPGGVADDTGGVSPMTPRTVRESSEEPSSSAAPDETDRFEEFWAVYPRRSDKKRARQKWGALMKRKVDPQRIIDSARVYATLCTSERREERYIRLPTTWLNGEPWEEMFVQQTLTTSITTTPGWMSWGDLTGGAPA